MAKALFITRNDLITFTSANGNLDPDKFLPYVRLASDIYLQTYLGTELYKKIESLIEAGTLTLVDNPNYYKFHLPFSIILKYPSTKICSCIRVHIFVSIVVVLRE